jgi:hypothetical protein
MIAGVGQRMLAGVAKKTAGEFFSAVDGVLTGSAPPSGADAAAQDVGAPTGAGAGKVTAASDAPRVFEAPGADRALASAGAGADFARGALVGAAAALLGALVGGWLAGRRRDT